MRLEPGYDKCVNRRIGVYHSISGDCAQSGKNLVGFIVQTKKQKTKFPEK